MITLSETEPKLSDPELVKSFEAQYDAVRLGQISKYDFIKARLTEREAARQRTDYDPLLQILNRRAFFDHVSDIIGIQARELEDKKIKNINGTLLMIDLDHFKTANDTYGHPEGDKILQTFSTGLEEVLKRPGDILGRYGGEEIIVYLTDTDSEGALNVAAQIKEKMQAIFGDNYPAWGGTASIGICQIPDYPSEEMISRVGEKGARSNFISTVLVKNADMALFEAKNLGRNRAEVWKKEEAPKTI